MRSRSIFPSNANVKSVFFHRCQQALHVLLYMPCDWRPVAQDEAQSVLWQAATHPWDETVLTVNGY